MKLQCYDCFKFYEISDDTKEQKNICCPFCGYKQDKDEKETNLLKKGTVLSNRYVTGRKIGQGGFGITYKCFDEHIGNIIAVKEYFLKEYTSRDPESSDVVVNDEKYRKLYQRLKDKFINEAKIMVRYSSHHNIVHVLDYFEENETAYIVMEYLDGTDLKNYLSRSENGKLDTDTAVKIILGVCNALRAIHKEGLVHRDISTDNIYICSSGDYKLLDFGATRAAHNAENENEKITVMLKHEYAPPEQYLKVNRQGAWTDIYALGVTLYRMLTGKMPEKSNERIIKDELVPPSELEPSIPKHLNDAIVKALELDMENRFRNIDEFEDAVLGKNSSEKISEIPKPEKNEEKISEKEDDTAGQRPDKIQCFDCFKFYKNTSENTECPFCGYKQSLAVGNILAEGTLLDGRYVIGRKCGQGGFGITYKSWDRKLERIVAVKEYFPSNVVNRVPGQKDVILSSNSERTKKEFQFGMDRYINEARVMAKYVSHENIINVYGYFEENNTAYIVMEFLDGVRLDDYLEKFDGGKIDTETAVGITSGICKALRTIHSDGMIHRDISPDNIYVCMNGKYKLYDFGAARFAKNENAHLTVILKPGYAPPEQYSNTGAQGTWTDIYALGASMYRMITGKMPDESMNRKIKDELKQPREWDSSIPQYINDAVMKAMALEPSLRFKNADEFEAAIKKEKKVEAVEKTVKKKRGAISACIGIASALIIAGTAVFANIVSANRLPSADIEVWYIEDEASPLPLDEIYAVFRENYKDINISFVGFDEENYEKALLDARDSGTMPALFMSDLIDTADYPTVSLKHLLSDSAADECLFIKEKSSDIQEEGKMPLGFSVPVVYINTLKCDYDKDTVSSISDIAGVLAVEENMTDAMADMFEDVSDDTVSAELFYNGEADVLFGDTSCFYEVQSSLPAQSKMLIIEGGNVHCRFKDCWSLSDTGSKEQRAVAEGFLKFMMNSSSQDHLYLRRQADALPLNKEIFDIYKSVYNDSTYYNFNNIMLGLENFVFDFYK